LSVLICVDDVMPLSGRVFRFFRINVFLETGTEFWQLQVESGPNCQFVVVLRFADVSENSSEERGRFEGDVRLQHRVDQRRRVGQVVVRLAQSVVFVARRYRRRRISKF